MTREATILTDGIFFGEGPRWHDGRLWFSDFYIQSVCSVSEKGDRRVEFRIDDRPSGLGWMPDGSMLIVSMTKRQLLRRTADGAIAVHADLSGIATCNCNDMVVDAQGRAYVGNFGFDLDAEIHKRGMAEVIANHEKAAMALVQPDGAVSVAADGLSFPNGTVITPDGKTLIVGESLGGILTAFDIGQNGALSNRRVWAHLDGKLADGIALDAEGAIWVANPAANECVRVAEGGEILDTVTTSNNCYACMLGGDDGKTLFMMTAAKSDAEEAAAEATGRVEVARVAIPHAGRP